MLYIKFSPSPLQGLSGGTTVSGTMIAAHNAGIPIFATGGIGGVHRGVEESKYFVLAWPFCLFQCISWALWLWCITLALSVCQFVCLSVRSLFIVVVCLCIYIIIINNSYKALFSNQS